MFSLLFKRQIPTNKTLAFALLISSTLGCIRSVPLTPPKLTGTSTPANATTKPSYSNPSGEIHSGSDCQLSIFGIFPINETPSISDALENAGFTLATPLLQFREEHLFTGILSRNCIVVFTDEKSRSNK